MKRIVLFDQDLRHYRQDIYKRFSIEFKNFGYSLIVYFDKRLNNIESDTLFKAIDYNYKSFKHVIIK